MKRTAAMLLLMLLLPCLFGCRAHDVFEIEFSIPPGSTGKYVFADEELSPRGNKLRLRAGAGYGEAAVILVPAEAADSSAYDAPIILKQGKTVTVNAEKGAWYRIGIADVNPDAVEKAVSVYAEDVDLRIE